VTTLTPTRPRREDRPLKDTSYAEGTTLGPHVEDFLASRLASRHFTPKTADNYRIYLSAMAIALRATEPDQVTVEALERIQASFPDGSIGNANSSMRSFWKWMRQRRRVSENPADILETPKRSKAIRMEVFGDAEVEALMAQPDIRDAALVRLLFDSGLRAEEFCALQMLHVRSTEGGQGRVTVVRGKGGKGRIVMIGKKTAGELALMSLVGDMQPTDYLLYRTAGGPLPSGTPRKIFRAEQASYTRFRNWFRQCCDTVGVEFRNPHTTRHSYASRWLRRNGNVAMLSKNMGHVSIATTVDIYGHFMTSDLEAEVARLEDVELVGQ
jgi:site-specific recombinase XerD